MVPEDAGADDQYTGGVRTTRVEQLLLSSVHYLAVTLSVRVDQLMLISVHYLAVTLSVPLSCVAGAPAINPGLPGGSASPSLQPNVCADGIKIARHLGH